MRRIFSFAAGVALAAAPAYAQTPPVQTRTQVQAPTGTQVTGRPAAGQNVGNPGTGQVGTRPIAGQSVPENQVGQVAGEQGQVRTGVGRFPRATANRTGVNDALFSAAAAASGLSEVTLSQLGVQRASDPELRQFSQRMIDDHTRINGELRTLAAQKGYRIPEMLDVRSQFCAQSLAGLSGEEFDKCYAKAQLVAHMEAVGAFEAQAQRGLDPDMKAFAARVLPRIKDHLRQIKPVAQKYMKDMEHHGGTEPSRIGVPGGQPIR